MTMNFAHRGFSAQYPENTMLAFRKAVEAGCDGIEMDVRLSLDGAVVISHDSSLARMAGAEGHVRDYPLAELKRINFCGSHPECGFTPIATLEEYFDYIRNTDVVTNIEIKSNVGNFKAIEDKCIELIRAYQLEEKIIFSSFNHYSMVYCKSAAPEIKTGLLFGTTYSEEFAKLGVVGYAKLCDADYLHPSYNGMTPEDVAAVQTAGVGVNVWTVDDAEMMRQYLAVDAHGIISNRPDILRDVIDNK